MNPVRRLRLQAGVSQRELAFLAGTSQPTIASYEKGTKSPTVQTIERLARALGFEAVVDFVPPMKREDLRSLAFHRAAIDKLRGAPADGLARARGHLGMLRRMHPDASDLLDRWDRWLELPLDELARRCLDTSLIGRDMRQVTPFAGLLSARERLAVLRSFRKEESAR